MLYRPNFCCHCGEKIVRARWTPLSSRRFCEFCEIEQKQHDLVPRAAMVIAILIGAAGLTAYVGGGGTAISPTKENSPTARRNVPELRSENGVLERDKANTKSSNANSATPSADHSNLAPANPKQRHSLENSSTEPVYYCGSITKKGTPCTRRVKVKGPCWQHAGRSAGLESEK